MIYYKNGVLLGLLIFYGEVYNDDSYVFFDFYFIVELLVLV